MVERYRTIYKGAAAEITEKKSRFIATLQYVENEEEALAFIEKMKKQYWNATHNCWAYVLGQRQETVRCSDDGEPQGTAGKPMLDVLTGSGICYGAAVVTRYFGGTLLGTGPAQSCAMIRTITSPPNFSVSISSVPVHWLC